MNSDVAGKHVLGIKRAWYVCSRSGISFNG